MTVFVNCVTKIECYPVQRTPMENLFQGLYKFAGIKKQIFLL